MRIIKKYRINYNMYNQSGGATTNNELKQQIDALKKGDERSVSMIEQLHLLLQNILRQLEQLKTGSSEVIQTPSTQPQITDLEEDYTTEMPIIEPDSEQIEEIINRVIDEKILTLNLTIDNLRREIFEDPKSLAKQFKKINDMLQKLQTEHISDQKVSRNVLQFMNTAAKSIKSIETRLNMQHA